MTDLNCDQELAVLGAVASGEWGPELQAHAENCPNCSEVVRVSHLLQQLVAAPKRELPSAGYVWWQARLRQRRAAQSRVTGLVAITNIATVSISITGLEVWIIWHWSDVAEGMKGFVSSLSLWSINGLTSNAPALVYVSAALLCLNLLLTVRAIVTNSKSK